MKRKLMVGNVAVGGGSPVTVQSMTNTDTHDAAATLAQINRLMQAGCDIVRVTLPDEKAVAPFREICDKSPLPVVADIHFDYKLALAAIDAGVAKIRINPGNIGSIEGVHTVAKRALSAGVPIRIGVNAGSLEKDLTSPTPQNMVESARRHIRLLEDCGFYDIALSLKSSDVKTTVEAYRLADQAFSYPLHVGITEAGTPESGIIRSAAGIGALLLSGIGDTIRVSLTADPTEEIRAGIELLKALGLRGGPKMISCPTCGRTQIDLIPLANEVQKRLSSMDKDITVAVMGCVVNGPGEARHADIGIAGGKGEALLFKKGKVLRKLPADRILEELFLEIERL